MIMSKLKIRNIRDTDLWELQEDYSYKPHERDIIIVPQGFQCDLASIPRPFWPIIGHPAGEYVEAAVVHDFCYRRHLYDRKTCDKIFLEFLKELKIPLWRRQSMYYFVRSFGWIPWKRYPATDSLTDPAADQA